MLNRLRTSRFCQVAAIAATISLSLLLAGCGGGNQKIDTPASAVASKSMVENLGDVRVWYKIEARQYDSSQTGKRGSQQEIYYVLVNESHSVYGETDPFQLPPEIFRVSDQVIANVLVNLQKEGLFQAGSGARRVNFPPDEYAKNDRREPIRWIGVEYKGKYTYFPAYDKGQSTGVLTDRQKRNLNLDKQSELFNRCGSIILRAPAHAWKPYVGSNAQDLIDPNQNNNSGRR